MLACVLLAMALYLAIDRGTVVEQELSGRVIPNPWSSYLDGNRPMSICETGGLGQATSSMQSGSTTNNIAEEDEDTPTCPISFTLSLSPPNLKQDQQSTSLVHALVTYLSGTPEQVTMSAKGEPAATEILFAPMSGIPSFSSALTITTSAQTPVGRFNITVLARGGGLEKSAILSLEVLPSLQIVPPVHDIAIVSARVQETATIGSIVSINATVSNHGSSSETFEIQAYANTTLVTNVSVPKLVPAATYMTRLMWNTTGYSPGMYTIEVAVPPVQGELNLLDNSREAGQILLTRTPGSGPSPSPSASGKGQGFIYGRQLAIVAAIAEAAIVFLAVLRSKSNASAGKASVKPRRN
jgi:hypothetical protein